MKFIQKISVLLMGLFIFSSCVYNIPVEEVLPPIEEDVSFAADVAPIFDTQECTNCHNGGSASTDLNLLSDVAYSSITNKGLIDMADPENSKIYYYPLPTGGHFKKYTSEQAQYVLTWIEQGAEDN